MTFERARRGRRQRRLRLALAIAAALGAALPAAGAAAALPELRVHGVVGFGLEAQRAPGAFRWNLDSSRADSALAILHLGAQSSALSAFVAVATGSDRERSRRLGLREASLAGRWRTAGGDSAAVRVFLDQPGALWFDHRLARPWSAVRETHGAGARIDAHWRRFDATAAAFERHADTGAARGDAWLARVRAAGPARLRIGATWSHEVPSDADVEPLRRDVVGFDVSAAWRNHTAAFDYRESHARFADAIVAQEREPGLRSQFHFARSRRLTDILPSNAALRAEVRVRSLDLDGIGRFGVAPSYRALGAHASDPLAAAERDFAAPRRGIEGPRLELWYEPAFWPGWARWVFDRHTAFRDGDRRVIAQQLEVQSWVHPAVRVRAGYQQREIRILDAGRRESHDDLLGELVAEERGARLRLQAARIDLDTETARTIGVLECGTRIAGRLQAGVRLAVAVRAAAVRRGAFLVARYVHLPRFEIAAQYGSEGLGDGTEPALDADLTAAGALEDRVRLVVRGWF